MRRPIIVFACLAGALISTTPEAEASLGKASKLPAKLFETLPAVSKPLHRPRAKPATIKKKQEPGEAPAGPPIKRGKGLA